MLKDKRCLELDSNKYNFNNVNIRLGLSRKFKFPVVYIGNSNFPIWVYPKLKNILKVMSVDSRGLLDYFKQNWINEYLPDFSLKGKTVLDVGSGCGESAYFFLSHGAKKVICIEQSYSRVLHLIRNNRNWSKGKEYNVLEVLHKRFNPENDLKIKADFMKVDIEGFEQLLLNYNITIPTVLEVHTWYLVEQFIKKGFRFKTNPDSMSGICIMTNYTSL